MRLVRLIPICLTTLGALAVTAPASATGTATTTSLAITAGGSAATSVASGTVVTLTARVLAGSTPVTAGQINFCDATATYCEDSHLIASVNLSGNTSASYKFRPGPGVHSYKAVFLQSPNDATSTSLPVPLAVTAPAVYPTVTAISQSGSNNDYMLTATVGSDGPTALSGNVSFIDNTAGDTLGVANLSANTTGGAYLDLVQPLFSVHPLALISADFNHDGVPDFASLNTGNNGNSYVTVYLGNGDGNFTDTGDKLVAGTATSLATQILSGDFNGDGIPDLAVLDYPYNYVESSAVVRIFIGDGTGKFTALTPISVGKTNDAGAVFSTIEVNGDGILDLAVATPNGVTILLGQGNGSFTALPQTMTLTDGLGSIAVADFNGDGIPDILVNGDMFLGVGDGTFTALPGGGGCAGSLVADFNGDGILDIATVYGGEVQVCLGTGNGSFTVGQVIQTSAYPGSARVADFNGDGIPDLAVLGGEYPSTSMAILLGNGDGTFAASTELPTTTGSFVTDFITGDFNGDGATDLLLMEESDVTGGWVPFTEGVPNVFIAVNQTATASISGVAALPAGSGTHQEVANYEGNGGNAASVSAATLLTAPIGAAVFKIAYSSNPAQYLSPVTITVTISGAGLTPTGFVSFIDGATRDGTNAIGYGTLNASGSASITYSGLTNGTHSITVSYAGDSNYAAGTSPVSTLIIDGGAPTTTTVTSSAPSIAKGLNVTFTAKVTGGGVAPTGTATFFDGSTQLGEGSLDSSGSATYVTSSLSVGTHSITATYAGDSAYSASTSAAIPQTITPPITPTVTVTPSATTISTTQALTVKVVVTGTSGNPTPTGIVGLSGGSYSGQAELSAGVATFSIAAGALTTGTDTLTASYTGTTPYANASANTTITVYNTANAAVMTSPAAGATFTGSSVTFNWTTAAGATGYYLLIGSTGQNSNNIYNSAEKTATSYTFTQMPTNGETIYVRLATNYNGTWVSKYYTYNAYRAPAAMTSPAQGSTLSGSSVTFDWTAATGATGYYLWIGSTGQNSNDIYNSAEKTTNSYTFTQMPTNGETIYVRLATNYNGTWVSNYYTYTAYRAPAAMTSPAQGSTLSGSSVTFDWTAATGATGYYLWIGSTGQNSNDIYNSAEKTTNSYTFTQMPTNGETIYVRLATNFNGTWVSNYYTYTAAANAPATMTSPAQGTAFSSSSVTFTWTAEPGATGYYLWVGSTGQNSNDIYNSAEKTTTSYTFTQMPTNGETIYVRLATNYNGTWVSNYYTYTAAP